MSQRASAALAAAPAKTAVARVLATPAPAELALPDFGTAEPQCPSRLATGGFAALRAGAVVDADSQRRQATQRLLEQLAPALGLDLSRLRVEVQASGSARLDAAGARGLQEGATIWLHPAHYQARRGQTRAQTEARYLLAHEATHAAQRRLAGPADGPAAEAEADKSGREFAAGRLPRRPRFALVSTRAAADADAKPDAPVVDTAMVELSRGRELALIRSALGGLWVSDGDVFDVMRVLDSLPYPLIKPVLGALEERERFWLADNINPPHIYQHRRSVLACYYDTLSDARLRDAADLKVFRALQPGGMSSEEVEAASWVLNHLSVDQRQELLHSEHALAISRLITPPRASATELARMAAAANNAARDEAVLAQQRRAIAAMADDGDAKDLLGQITSLLSPPPTDFADPRPTPAQARASLDLLARARASQARLLYVAERMEEAGLIDQLLELLPANSYFDTDDHSATLIELVQSRLPIKNEKLVESLLSYGLFDWAIRDHEALFAYKLIRLLPMADQYRFRQRDGGKWYLRLLDNLPDDPDTLQPRTGLEIRKAESREELDRMRSQGASTEVAKQGSARDKDEYYYNASEIYEKKLRDSGVNAALQELLNAFKEARKGIFRDAEAKALYAKVVALGAASLQPGAESPGDALLRETVVRELDRNGCIEELFGQLPDGFLYAEENRISTVKIMLSRDSIRVQAHARELVSRGFTDWMVLDNEAYLAYQCVKALPAEEREAFVQNYADLWARIQAEMSRSMRQARDLNLYTGDKAGTDRASVLAQLADAQTWQPGNAGILGNLLRMAVAMTEHKFAFERSREFNAAAQPALADLVAQYRLWDPAQKRTEYSPELLRGTHWYEEGPFASLKSLWGGLVTLWNLDVLFVDGKIGARVDLNDVQDFMGGDLMGAQLANPAQRGSRQGPAGPDANKLTLLLDPGWFTGQGKSAEVILPQLLIDSSNVQLAGTTLQTGTVELNNLHIRAAFGSQNQGQASQAQVSVDSVTANDLLLARSTSMLTITRLVVQTLRLAAGTIDTTTGAPGPREGRYVPFPLLVVPMLAVLALLAVPVLIYRSISGLRNQGLEPENSFGPDIATRTKAIDFSFSSLAAEGVSTSGGQHVAHAQVRDFALRVGLNKATRLRAELASIEQRKTALQARPEAAEALAKLQARQAELQAQRKDIETQEQAYLRIQGRILSGTLKADEQRALQDQLNALNFEDQGGAFIDIGAVEASGISGTLTSQEPIRLAGVHGEGASSALMGFVSAPVVTADELARRTVAGERPPPLVDSGREGSLKIELGDVHTGRIEVGGGVRTVADIDAKLTAMPDADTRPEMRPLRDSLVLLRTKAVRYEAMVAYGVSALSPAQLDEFRALRLALSAEAALIVQSIDLTRVRLDVDLASGRIDVGADKARMTGLQLPQKGIEVQEIVATGIRAGALPAGGLLDWSEWKKHLRDADGKIDTLEVTGVRSKYHGLLFEKATLTGAYAQVQARGNLVKAGLQQLNVEGLGLVPRLGLLNQRLDGLRQKARVVAAADKPALEAEIGKLATLVADLQSLADRRLAAFMRLERASTPQEIADAKAEVAEVDGTIAEGLAQYGVASLQLDEFGVRIAGAGDVLSDALGGGIDPLALLERGDVSVTGAGPNGRLFKRLALHQAQTVVDQPGSGLQADAGSIDIGETRLDITAHKDGDSLLIQVPQFEVDALSLSRMLLTSSEGDNVMQAWSTGSSGLERLTFKGSVRLDSRVPHSRDLADYRLALVHVDSFNIGRFYGNGLGFALPSKKLELDITSGSINGIHGQGVDVAFPADDKAAPLLTGKLGIDAVDKLVVGNAMVGAWAAKGGRIDAKDISVEMFEDGGIKATIGDLDLTDFSLRGPDGWVRFSLADLGGKFSWRDGALDIEDIHFGSLRVAGIHWKVGETGFVESNKPSTVSDLALKGRIETREEPVKATPGKAAKAGATRRAIRKLHIERLHVGKLESEHLVYQDENNRIELRPADPMMEKHMVGFKPLFVQNLNVWGLEWTPEKNISSGKATADTYEASAHYEGLASGLRAGIALTGKGMSAEMVGPDAFTVDVGKISKAGGELHNAKFDTGFASGSIVGKVAIGPDYVELQNIEIGKTLLTGMRWRDLPKILMLDSVNIDRIKLGKVRQNYSLSTDPATLGEKTPTTLTVRDVELFDILARELDYQGESRASVGEGKDKKEEVSSQHIKGRIASISHLQVSKFDHDALAGTSELSAKIDTAAGAKPGTHPFGVQGLSAELINTIGSETTKKSLLTDVQGGPLTAEGIKFASVVLGTATGPDGKPMDVTRTSIDGSFVLAELGFINPDLTLTDKKGKATTLGGYGSRIDIAGIRPTFLPNGAVALPIDSIIAKGLTLKRGNMTATLPLLEIKGIAVGLRNMGTAKGLDWMAAKIGEIHVQGLSVEIVNKRKAQLSGDEFDAAKKDFADDQRDEAADPSGKLIVEPLSGLQGSASGEYSLDNFPDPDITPTIKNGVIELGGMTNYSVQLHTEDVTRDGVTRPEDKITLGNVVTVKTLKDFKRKMPGFYGDEGKYNYGRIDLRETIEGLANEPATAPEDKFEPPEDLRNFTGFTGDFALGNGRLGRDKDGDKKLGDGDTWVEFKRDKPGQNTIKLLNSNIGKQVNLEMPEFHFGSAGFTAGLGPDGKTRVGKTGEITLQEMAVKVSGLSNFTMTLTLEIKDAKISNVVIGDVTFVDAAELAKLVAPTVTDVDPKGVPK